MAEKTAIQWTDATVNFWTGCKKVSDGCKYCYMYRDKERYGKDPAEVVKVSEKTVNRVLKEMRAQDAARPEGAPRLKIFPCSWSDFFIEEADAWRPWAWDIIRAHQQFDWQILTKRPENILARLPEEWDEGWPNVWLGVSVENEKAYNRIETLVQIPAAIRFVSYEPLLGPVSVPIDWADGSGMIDWAIIGGESGNDTGRYKYRECKEIWINDLLSELQSAKVPTFVKQVGTHLAKKCDYKARHGGDWEEWPRHIRVREFPEPVTV